MKLKLRRVGNSLGVIIPRELLEGYAEGDMVDIRISGEVVAILKDSADDREGNQWSTHLDIW